jgi:hypothetical protein
MNTLFDGQSADSLFGGQDADVVTAPWERTSSAGTWVTTCPWAGSAMVPRREA